MKRHTFQTAIYHYGRLTARTVHGWMAPTGVDQIPMVYLYQKPGGLWYAIEPSRGMGIFYGDTRTQALERAMVVLRDKTPEEITRCIEASPLLASLPPYPEVRP